MDTSNPPAERRPRHSYVKSNDLLLSTYRARHVDPYEHVPPHLDTKEFFRPNWSAFVLGRLKTPTTNVPFPRTGVYQVRVFDKFGFCLFRCTAAVGRTQKCDFQRSFNQRFIPILFCGHSLYRENSSQYSIGKSINRLYKGFTFDQ